MAAVAAHQLSQCITCHAWNAELSMVAVCPNNSEVHIYKASPDGSSIWNRIHILQKHDQLISGIDWGMRSNKIVTVSHDRNSYVWSLEGVEWLPTLVILRLNRAAICVKWSPRENKFAVGSGAKSVCICYYEQDNNWWVSKLIRKKHNSSVTSVAWHPNNVLLATSSADGKCRVFSTFIKGVDTRDSTVSPFCDMKFGEQVVQLDLAYSWAFGAKWSPSGNSLAYVGHSSTIYFIDDVGPSAVAQEVAFRDLPLRDILFLSEKMVVGVGFDCNPMLFAADSNGTWSFVKFLDEKKSTATTSKYGSQFSEAFGKFYGQAKHGSNVDSVEPSRAPGGSHENCITCIVPLPHPGETTLRHFSTSGMDGKVVIWELNDLDSHFSQLAL
ncbi:actin-related protein 2/3 complex subunit 1A [Cryptomeria japonica]|uniref:actin-related protein 2/3 complex subunit 1A n=1 Tax=Cryptomeria japonica TaxID=3369 RepID=UPI0025ACEC5D|nr:actin-related protein 2/3 complex subunit 1A [Cryptomeria japonica]XP_057861256.1 actin-related protein 2/3 complex subunit 1A [Cryptomeria japonica]